MRTHSVLNFLVFTCFLVVGYTFSIRFYQPGDFSSYGAVIEVTAGNHASIETMKNGQRSLLLIKASEINTVSPHLESIWLATYLTSDPTIQLLPIFPSGSQTISDFETQLGQSFSLRKSDRGLVLDQGFISLLKDQNYWWSGYIIFDDASLTKIINLLGGVEVNGKMLSGAQVLDEIPAVLDNPQNAYSSQVAMIQSICHKFIELEPEQEMSQLMPLFANHILTDLDSYQLQKELDMLSSSGHNSTCRFPTLGISRIEP